MESLKGKKQGDMNLPILLTLAADRLNTLCSPIISLHSSSSPFPCSKEALIT